MKMNQSKHNIFTKGLDDTEASILAVVKRFLEKDPTLMEGSIDHIVMEILRRVKTELINGTLVASVSSVNGQIGQVVLSPLDIGAEPLIDKSRAFNKEFGTDKDTICEGNDPRLSDDRYPLKHDHDDYIAISQVNEYIEKFLSSKGIEFTDGEIVLNGNVKIRKGSITEE